MECGAQSVTTTGQLKTLKLPVGHWDYLQPVRILSLRLNILSFLSFLLIRNMPVVVKNYHEAYFGEGEGPIFLSRLRCIGTEANLTNCSHSQEINCVHEEDAGVQCLATGLSGQGCSG